MAYEPKNELTKSFFEVFDRLEAMEDNEGVFADADESSATLTVNESAVSEALESAGLSWEQMCLAQEVEASLLTATTATGAAKALSLMEKDEKAETFGIEMKVGHNNHSIMYDREGNVTTITHQPYVNDNGDMNEISRELKDTFGAALGAKEEK